MAEVRPPPPPARQPVQPISPDGSARNVSQNERPVRGDNRTGQAIWGAWGGWALAPDTASMGRDYRSHQHWSRHRRRTFKPPAIFFGLFLAGAALRLDAPPGLRCRHRETDNLLALQPAHQTRHLILRYRLAAKLQAKHPAPRIDDRGLIAVDECRDVGDALV